MAKQEQGEKTEKPTPRRRNKAREEGQVARSQEVGAATSLLAAVLAVVMIVPGAFETLRETSAALWISTDGTELPSGQILDFFWRIATTAILPIAGIAAFFGVLAGASQVGFRITPKAAKPKLDKLDPRKGLEKLKPKRAGWELIRATTKLGLLFALAAGPLTAWTESMGQGRGLGSGLSALSDEAWTLLMRAFALAVVVALADYLWQRHTTEKKLKMSKHEIKQEHKQTEGDPQIKQSRRQRMRELSRNRMLADVPKADVVVTNPTHLAVALRYSPDEAAPRVVAKGADHLAEKIRTIAYRHGVTVTEDKPLAQTLYRKCKVGQLVPAALYEAVAVVLALAYRRTGRRATAGAGR
ncbi:EscU/YscU/HrcU family type III secretion system export apparatus switch protein [Egibacter rhizosphaerae]|uniref:EscU/YscU/HrcU family type III secretion system export apparatus switch protein n=1 Tax=Egibacter rhizosphaerae TaxID=1670831 RepID=A0A411YJC7_9ACTN|nr:EscU/YscU/HrcU family type III secretion system export apparatus switch protein [Egibacter rhizosphaerae]QBI21251.1 EscU/YscU/HrcU family type III secretion system export apparatus switch protein [Egibacter rhizosphaerae]